MTQTAETQTPAAETAAPVARVANEKKNGVVRPSANTQTGQVWAICEALGTKLNRAPKRSEVIEAATAAGINPATASTQFGKWCKFWGVQVERAPAFGRTPKAEGAEGEAAPAAPKAAKGKKSGKQNLTAAAGAAALGAAEVETEGAPAAAPEASEPTANEFLAQQAQG